MEIDQWREPRKVPLELRQQPFGNPALVASYSSGRSPGAPCAHPENGSQRQIVTTSAVWCSGSRWAVSLSEGNDTYIAGAFRPRDAPTRGLRRCSRRPRRLPAWPHAGECRHENPGTGSRRRGRIERRRPPRANEAQGRREAPRPCCARPCRDDDRRVDRLTAGQAHAGHSAAIHADLRHCRTSAQLATRAGDGFPKPRRTSPGPHGVVGAGEVAARDQGMDREW